MKPLDNAKRVFAFLGIEFTSQTEKFLVASTSKKSNKYFSVSRKSDEVTGKRMQHLEPNDIDTILIITNSMPRLAEVIARTS
jgi:hypothetical protein